MLSRWFLFTIIILLCLSFGCGDDGPTKPVPEEKFELRVTAQRPDGSPVAGLQVSAWNLIQKTEIRFNSVQAHPSQASATAGLPGDVNCDGTAYTPEDLNLYFSYLLIGDSIVKQRNLLDCFLTSGDLVKESPGVSTADYYQALLIAQGMPTRQNHVTHTLTYTYDIVNGSIQLDQDLMDQGIKLAALRIVSGPSDIGSSSKIADDCITVDYWTRDSVSTILAVVWPDAYNPCGDFIESLQLNVGGGIALMEGTTNYGDPVVFERRASKRKTATLAPQPSDSVITIQFPFLGYPYSLVTRDLHGIALDSIYGVSPDPSVPELRQIRPNSGRPGVYIIELLIQETPELLGKGQSFAVIWSEDPERNQIGTTDVTGRVTCTDDLLFPGLLMDTPIYGWVPDSTLPLFYVGYDKVEYLDSIRVVVRDTLTNLTVEGTYPLSPKKNDITITWP